jgi:hypothetical protein
MVAHDSGSHGHPDPAANPRIPGTDVGGQPFDGVHLGREPTESEAHRLSARNNNNSRLPALEKASCECYELMTDQLATWDRESESRSHK